MAATATRCAACWARSVRLGVCRRHSKPVASRRPHDRGRSHSTIEFARRPSADGAFGFTLEYDGAPFQFASITGPSGETLTPSGPTDVRRRAGFDVSLSGLLLDPGQDILLAKIHGLVPSTFAVVGQTPLVLSNATFDYLAQPPALNSGDLLVRSDVLDVGEMLEVEPGDEIFVQCSAPMIRDSGVHRADRLRSSAPLVRGCVLVRNRAN